VLPGGAPEEQLEQAVIAEDAGWDGVFVWEGAYGVDAWSLLAAMAVRTERIRLGTMLTPLPWRRPWKVASQAATLDQLSGGRAILSVGLGALETGLGSADEITDRRVRAELLDEGIDVLTALWSGELKHEGQHHHIDLTERRDLLRLEPVQKPRIPIWCVGAWPRPKSMRRVLRCDGVLPVFMDEKKRFREMKPDDVAELVAWLRDHGAPKGFDIVVEGETPDDPAAGAEIVQPLMDAGATWWNDSRWQLGSGRKRDRAIRARLEAGPPSIA
jgi:hypothetical protein